MRKLPISSVAWQLQQHRPFRRKVGAGGDVQISVLPTTIVLYDVEPASLIALRKRTWTHVHWAGVMGNSGRDLQVGQILIEGKNVRVIV